LSPSDRPQDVYTVVLKIVQEKVQKDAAGDGDSANMAQRVLELKVLQRRVVKRTVMTICYGVTAIGAKQQVQGELEDMVGDRVDPKDISEMAKYLSRHTLRSIDVVFERAMKIKRWFDQVSKICNTYESPVSWMSAVGLACVQPYRKMRISQVKTKKQRISIADRDGPLVNKFKQRLGFPPNFIHSLDASHMMMVAEGCEQEGLCFAGVHDSFWTHACDASKLSKIIRSAFMDLHGRPLLKELSEDLQIHFGATAKVPELPEQGTLDIALVEESKYIFS